MVKLKDVADYVGLSISTVSRVINNQDPINPKTRKKVEEAVRKLGYQPNEVARRLKMNVSDVIGVVVPDITNPFFAAIVRGVQLRAAQEGYQMLLCDTDADEEKEKKSINLLIRQKVAAIICATVTSESKAEEIYKNLSTPIVFIDNTPPIDRDFSSVTINNYLAAKELTVKLIEQGHRSIWMIAGPESESSARDRMQGYLAAMRENSGVQARILYGDNREISGKRCMDEILKEKNRPTAILTSNNFMAYGAMNAMLAKGVRTPEDIAVATFDVFDNTGLIKKSILSVQQPADGMGNIAVELCLGKNQQGVQGCRKVVLMHNIE